MDSTTSVKRVASSSASTHRASKRQRHPLSESPPPSTSSFVPLVPTSSTPTLSSDHSRSICEIRERGPKLQSIFENLNDCLADYGKGLTDQLGEEDSSLSFPHHRFLKSVVYSPVVSVAFAGANNSGKSTLINALIGKHLMPTGDGFVTGRICCVRDGPPEVSIYVLDEERNIIVPDPSQERYPSLTPDELRQLVWQLTCRPEDPDEFAKWITKIVVVQQRLEFLADGITIYDLPGVSTYDDQQVQSFLSKFLVTIQPVLAFVYSNPTMVESEIPAIRFLDDALNSDTEGSIPPNLRLKRPILYISNHFDIDNLSAAGYTPSMSNPDQFIRDQMSFRKRLFVQRRPRMYENLPDDDQGLPSASMSSVQRMEPTTEFFACVSARDIVVQKWIPPIILHQFMSTFGDFLVQSNRIRVQIALHVLLSAIDHYFQDLLFSQNVDESQFNRYQATIQTLQECQKECFSKVEDLLIKKLPNRLKTAFTSSRTQELARKKALSIRIPQEGQNARDFQQVAFQAFSRAFQPWVDSTIIRPKIATAKQELEDIAEAGLNRILAYSEEDSALKSVLLEVFDSNIFLSDEMIRTQSYTRLRDDAPPESVMSFVVRIAEWIFGSWNVIDDKFKEKCASFLLDSYSQSSLSLSAKNDIRSYLQRNFFKPITNELRRRRSRANQLSGKLAQMEQFHDTYRERFGKLLLQIYGLRFDLFSLPIVFSRVREHSTLGEWESCTIEGVPHKALHLQLNDETRHSFFQQFCLYHQASVHNLKRVLQCHHFIEHANEWILITQPFSSTLLKYHDQVSSKLLALKVARSIAEGLAELHQQGLFHSNLTLENILVDKTDPESPKTFLYNFASVDIESQTRLLQDEYKVVEHCNRLSGRDLDIYCFGRILKILIDRFTTPSISKFIQQCMNRLDAKPFPDDRPLEASQICTRLTKYIQHA